MNEGATVYGEERRGEIGAGAVEAPNRIESTDLPHVRRCMKFGLVDVINGSTLRLTELGQSTLCAYAFEHGQSVARQERA